MKSLNIGQKESVSRIFTVGDLLVYRQLTGDSGLRFASVSPDIEHSIPGPLLGGMISELLGTRLPGEGTTWLKQNFRFLKPAKIGQQITATGVITRLRAEKSLVNLKVRIENAEGVVCEGETLVLAKGYMFN